MEEFDENDLIEEEIELGTNEWQMNELEEKYFLVPKLINHYIYQPNYCPPCKSGKFVIRENKKNKVISPYILACINKKYKKKSF